MAVVRFWVGVQENDVLGIGCDSDSVKGSSEAGVTGERNQKVSLPGGPKVVVKNPLGNLQREFQLQPDRGKKDSPLIRDVQPLPISFTRFTGPCLLRSQR